MSGTPGQQSLSQRFPGGFYLGFNAAIDRKAAEQLTIMVADAIRNGFQEINICMSSLGGVLDHTYYAFNILESLSIKIVTWNVGNIQSAANILYLCGDERYATPASTFFFHQTAGDFAGGRITEPVLQGKLTSLQHDDTRSAAIIAAKTGKTLQDVRSWQNTELVMDTTAALAHGIIDSVRSLVVPPDAFFHQLVV
jgi:ATP-dependent protease ClpP protease subunit